MDLSQILFFIRKEEIFSIPNIFMIFAAIFWMIISSIQDFKRREVENWWNFSLIVFILIFRVFLSIEKSEILYIVWGVIGLSFGFLLANVFYYSRMFAGGDAKLLMALGTILPLSLFWQTNVYLFLIFIMFLLFSGSIYGIVYSIILTYINFKKFKKEFSIQIKKYRLIIYSLCGFFALIFIVFILLKIYFFSLILLILLITPLLLVYAKSIENCCMEKLVDVKELTIGDWTKNSIHVKNHIIKPNWEGLNEKELKLLQKYYKKKVIVKNGIPFVPVFLIAFILMVLFFWRFLF